MQNYFCIIAYVRIPFQLLGIVNQYAFCSGAQISEREQSMDVVICFSGGLAFCTNGIKDHTPPSLA